MFLRLMLCHCFHIDSLWFWPFESLWPFLLHFTHGFNFFRLGWPDGFWFSQGVSECPANLLIKIVLSVAVLVFRYSSVPKALRMTWRRWKVISLPFKDDLLMLLFLKISANQLAGYSVAMAITSRLSCCSPSSSQHRQRWKWANVY